MKFMKITSNSTHNRQKRQKTQNNRGNLLQKSHTVYNRTFSNCEYLNRTSGKEKESLHKFFKVDYLIAKKGILFTDYHDIIELEKLHGIKFGGTHDNRDACANFITYVSRSLFNINVKSKLKRVNSIMVFCDGTTNAEIIEKENVFVWFIDPDDLTPSMTFFH